MNESALVAAIVGFLSARGGAFLDKVFGKTADAIGDDVFALYQKVTGRNVSVVLDSAAEMLEAAGETPQPVPGRILMPILHYCAVEQYEDLRAKWAALLANAASSSDANKVLPAYAEILRQLTPVQARILDWIFDQAFDSTIGFLKWPDVKREDVERAFGLSSADYALFVSDMDRLQVLEGRRDTNVPAHLSMTHEQMQELIIGRWESREKYNLVTLTTLGVGFMYACTPPRQVQAINGRLRSR
jgi:hypothetical protein